MGALGAASAKVKEVLNMDGKHDTTVHETVAPAVQHEVVQRDHTEKAREVVDKEVHQNHYHTSVQPIKDMEIKDTQHHENIVPTQERTFTHGDADRDLNLRAEEAAKFNDSRVVQETSSAEQEAAVGAERVHHHVHETIQPVINKQTIEPHVTHTTIPIHEVHENAAVHHTTSALPAVSMSEFERAGGILSGRDERKDAFDGEPHGVGSIGQNTTTAASERSSANPLSAGSSHTPTSANPLSAGSRDTTSNATGKESLIDRAKDKVGMGHNSSSSSNNRI